MSAKITRFPSKRSKRQDAITEAAQLLLDMQSPLGLKDATRDDIAEAVERFAPPPPEKWNFGMLNHDQARLVLKAINASPRPLDTLRVWNAVTTRVRYDTGEIMAGRDRLAEDAGTSPQEVSRALTQLVKIGALSRIGKGRYAINPCVGWTGNLDKREAVAKASKPVELRLISD